MPTIKINEKGVVRKDIIDHAINVSLGDYKLKDITSLDEEGVELVKIAAQQIDNSINNGDTATIITYSEDPGFAPPAFFADITIDY